MIKKLLFAVAILSLLVACDKTNFISESEYFKLKKEKKDKKDKVFTSPLSVDAQDGSEPLTRIYDHDLVWHWEYGDALVGYQIAGNNLRNRLEYDIETQKFSCPNFTYQSNQDERFHFVYPYAAEFQKGKLRPVQDGNWRPVCVVTTDPAKIQKLPRLIFEQLSSALEIRVWNQNNKMLKETVISAVLTSDSDFVPVWVFNQQDMRYEQTLNGKKIEVKGLNSSVVQLNMPHLPDGYPSDVKIKLVLTREDGKTMTTYLPSHLVFEKQRRTIYNLIFVPDPSFTCATYNVDGLAEMDNINGKSYGLRQQMFKFMSSKLAQDNWDIIGFQENFDFNIELSQYLTNYYLGDFRGQILSPSFYSYTDGLYSAVNKTTCQEHGYQTYIAFTHTYGDYYNGLNECIARGFRYFTVTLKDGVQIDVYLSQMNVGPTAEHRAARASNYRQLAEYINTNRTGRPIIIMGDFAGLYTTDDFETNFRNVLAADLRDNLSDPWVDIYWGYFPSFGEPAYVPSDLYDPIVNANDYKCGEQDGEVPYKILYINDPRSNVNIWAKNYKRDMTYVDFLTPLPVVVEFGYEKVN